MKSVELTAEIWREGNMYTAYCHELEVATAGRNIEEAKKNLRAALEIFFEETARLGTLREFLAEAGISMEGGTDEIVPSARAAFCQIEKLRLPVPPA